MPVVILGAGINGAAIARELTLCGLSVWLVDTADLSSGTTAFSSRLIHGGLRYLEQRDFRLVAESLAERTRLLKLAPHLVRPLRMFIPVEQTLGGWINAIGNFFGASRWLRTRDKTRGRLLIRTGLQIYDWLAQDSALPSWSRHVVGDPAAPQVDPDRFRWLYAYSDAQVIYPERLVISMLRDAEQAAAAANLDFRVFTYHAANLRTNTLQISSKDSGETVAEIRPAAIVNATGAWVDHTLRHLQVPAERLIGGTKGSHFVTFNTSFVETLQGAAVYGEARDGRPVFLLPFGEGALVGTTDIPYNADPGTVRASDEEIDYLLQAAGHIFPQARLARSDIHLHYCGVRPLPYVGPKTPASISRQSHLVQHTDLQVPLISVVGGKLTTCRALGEDTAKQLCQILKVDFEPHTRSRKLFGAPVRIDDMPIAATQSGAWQLLGEEASTVLDAAPSSDRAPVTGTDLPRAIVRHVIRHEWVRTLSDLVERRLMLIFHRNFSVATLHELAQMMVQENRLMAVNAESTIVATQKDLGERYGMRCCKG